MRVPKRKADLVYGVCVHLCVFVCVVIIKISRDGKERSTFPV